MWENSWFEDGVNSDKDSWWKDIERPCKSKEDIRKLNNELYTEYCTMNHENNSEYEKGMITALLKALNISKKYIK